MSRLYKCLPQQVFEQGAYRIEPVSDEHIESIRQWRNAQMDVLRQSQPITEASQQAYFQQQIFPSMDAPQPVQILFALFYKQELIGYGGLVHIAWADQRAEVSFLVNPDRVAQPALYQQDFLQYLTLIKTVAFNALGFNRLFTETYDLRPHHITILEESGFRREGTMRQHIRLNTIFVDSILHGYLQSDWHVNQ